MMPRPRWLDLSSAPIAILTLACIGLGYEQYKLRQNLTDLEWRTAVDSHVGSYSTMTMELGVIQFLKSGFSVTLDSAEVTSTGVVLVGKFGNPKVLTLSGLTLEFQIEKPIWEVRKVWDKDRFALLFGDSLTVGKAQVSIGDVVSCP